jgi:hypothetical protein
VQGVIGPGPEQLVARTNTKLNKPAHCDRSIQIMVRSTTMKIVRSERLLVP